MSQLGWAVIGAAIGTTMPIAAAAQERGYGWGWGMHPMGGVWGAWGLGMMLMMFVFWGVVIVGAVLGIRWLAASGPTRDR